MQSVIGENTEELPRSPFLSPFTVHSNKVVVLMLGKPDSTCCIYGFRKGKYQSRLDGSLCIQVKGVLSESLPPPKSMCKVSSSTLEVWIQDPSCLITKRMSNLVALQSVNICTTLAGNNIFHVMHSSTVNLFNLFSFYNYTM